MENVTVNRKEGGDLRERRDTEKRYDTVIVVCEWSFVYTYIKQRKKKKEKEEKETTNNVLSLSLIATYHVSAVAS